MAIHFEEALKNILKKGDKNVFVLLGEDGYLKRFYVDKLTKNIASDDDVFNYQRFEQDTPLQEVYDAVQQFPMMNDKKVVILRDFDFSACDATDFNKLLSLLSDVPETTVFIMWYDALEVEIKKNAKLDKIVKACDGAGGAVVNLSHRKGFELEKMLNDGALKRGCKMENGAAKFLIENVGDDIFTLKNELEKLCAYAKGEVITKAIIEKVAVKTVESDIYALADKILKCDLSAAYKILDDLFFMRVDPIIILSTISSVYVDMYRLLAARSHNFGNEKIAEDFAYGNRSFLIKNAAYNLKKFDFNKLQLSLNELAAADKAIKSFSGDERVVLEKLIVELSYIAVKGESID